VLTNPPFGDDRAFVPKDEKDLEMIQCYELWHLYSNKGEEDNSERKQKEKTREISYKNRFRGSFP
jgi:type I restriction enzyme M protein